MFFSVLGRHTIGSALRQLHALDCHLAMAAVATLNWRHRDMAEVSADAAVNISGSDSIPIHVDTADIVRRFEFWIAGTGLFARKNRVRRPRECWIF